MGPLRLVADLVVLGMSWVKLTDGFPGDPGLIRAGRDAFVVHVCALAYVMGQDNVSDGVVLRRVAQTLGASYVDDVPAAVVALVREGVWVEVPEGYRLVLAMADQREHDLILKVRESGRLRQRNYYASKVAKKRAPNGVTDGVRTRDQRVGENSQSATAPNAVTNAVPNAYPAQPSPEGWDGAAGTDSAGAPSAPQWLRDRLPPAETVEW